LRRQKKSRIEEQNLKKKIKLTNESKTKKKQRIPIFNELNDVWLNLKKNNNEKWLKSTRSNP
jgi:hypothetical protein